MIRKIINILLVIFILFSNSGWGVSLHFCKDKLTSISLSSKLDNQKDECLLPFICCYGEDNHQKCCRNTVIESSNSSNNVTSEQIELNLFSFIIIPEYQLLLLEDSYLHLKKSVLSFYIDSNAPPLYKLYCQFVFYD